MGWQYSHGPNWLIAWVVFSGIGWNRLLASDWTLLVANPAQRGFLQEPTPAFLTRTDLFGSGWIEARALFGADKRVALVFCWASFIEGESKAGERWALLFRAARILTANGL
jgi:hypothetical protein